MEIALPGDCPVNSPVLQTLCEKKGREKQQKTNIAVNCMKQLEPECKRHEFAQQHQFS